MPDMEKVVGHLNDCMEASRRDNTWVFVRKDIVEDALVLLKEQEESIPVSWLKEKLEGHPELSYAVTDGIINVLDLWEGR